MRARCRRSPPSPRSLSHRLAVSSQADPVIPYARVLTRRTVRRKAPIPFSILERGETVWESERGGSMTHARGRGKVPSERSTRWWAGVPEAPCPGPRQARKTGDPRRPRDPRRRLLRAKGRPPLGAAAPRLPAPGDRSLAVREAARGWDPRTAQRRPARAPAESPGHEPAPERGYSRPPDGRDHGGRRRAGRLRRRQGDPGHKAPPPGGHRRVGPRGRGPQRGGARPGRPEAAVGAGARRALAPRAPAPRAPAAGRRLRGKGREVGRGGHGLECGGRARAAQARTRGGGEGVGRGAGRGGARSPTGGGSCRPEGA